jgi:hypothetical protein
VFDVSPLIDYRSIAFAFAFGADLPKLQLSWAAGDADIPLSNFGREQCSVNWQAS